MTNKTKNTVIASVAVGGVVAAVGVGVAYVRNPAYDPTRDPVALWCRVRTGAHSDNTAPVGELEYARSGNGNVMLAAFNEAPLGEKVEDRFAPEPIRDVAHRFGQGIVDSVKDPAKLNDPSLDADAATLQDWIRANCTGPDRTG
jgi:hypothetical protein